MNGAVGHKRVSKEFILEKAVHHGDTEARRKTGS